VAGGFNRARSAVAAVGLGRRPPDEPERLRSDRPEPCSPSGLGLRVVHVLRLAPHPVTRLEPWSAPSRAGGSLRAILRPVRSAERCVSPTPATDSCHEHPAVRSIPGGTPVRAAPRGVSLPRAPTHPGREPRRRGVGTRRSACRMSQPGGASLDGEPPASALAATIT
jgi:hypothetical protein